jgi:DNA repair photolyase
LILSVSRRTDIPAFYSEWFFNRLKEGFVLVRNPMSYHQVSRVKLTPDVIDCIVFWTKDPGKMLGKLHLLDEYKYYFQITINPYEQHLERRVSRPDKVIKSFQELSSKIGTDRVIWRYDPIILTKKMNLDYHTTNFNKIASILSGHTKRCIISFVDNYRKTERNMKSIVQEDITGEIMLRIGERFAEIGDKYNLKISTCSEIVDLSAVGIEHAKCIDDRFISQIIGESLIIAKDKNQREECGCVTSIDIGAYNTCKHGCLYCYANFSENAMINNAKKHDKNSPMLIGNIKPDDKIKDRKMESYKKDQGQGILDF